MMTRGSPREHCLGVYGLDVRKKAVGRDGRGKKGVREGGGRVVRCGEGGGGE